MSRISEKKYSNTYIGNISLKKFSEKYGISPNTVKSHMRMGKCAWPRKTMSGVRKHPLYNIWNNMMQRCNNKNTPCFHRYGGRGIKVCDRWHDFHKFAEDVGDRPKDRSLDRINNDGNYEPKNCRWATKKTQANNTSKKGCVFFDKNAWNIFYRKKYIGRFKSKDAANLALIKYIARLDNLQKPSGVT